MKNWFLLAVVTSLLGAALAQTAPATAKKLPIKLNQKMEQAGKLAAVKPESKIPPVVKFSMAMLEGGRIEPGYTGIPVAKVIDAIDKVMIGTEKKGQFETTAAHNARRAAALTGKLLGDLTLDDTLAFVFSVPNFVSPSAGFAYDFNADAGKALLFALPKVSSINGIGAPYYLFHGTMLQIYGFDQFDLDFNIDSNSTYESSNAYGARITVQKTISTGYGIAVNRMPFLNFKREKSYSYPSPTVQVSLEKVSAAKELPALKAIVVMKIADPYVVYDSFSSTPTLSDPFDITRRSKYLTGNVLGIIFYSGLTGEIFARLPDTFGRLETKIESNSEDKPVGQ